MPRFVRQRCGEDHHQAARGESLWPGAACRGDVTRWSHSSMGISWGYPFISSMFIELPTINIYKPSIFGYPHFRKPPNGFFHGNFWMHWLSPWQAIGSPEDLPPRHDIIDMMPEGVRANKARRWSVECMDLTKNGRRIRQSQSKSMVNLDVIICDLY